jgi:hypothetical protein
MVIAFETKLFELLKIGVTGNQSLGIGNLFHYRLHFPMSAINWMWMVNGWPGADEHAAVTALTSSVCFSSSQARAGQYRINGKSQEQAMSKQDLWELTAACSAKVDGSRKRRLNDKARRQWYASRRNQRFARRTGFPTNSGK